MRDVRARRQHGAEGKQCREAVAVDEREEESGTMGGWMFVGKSSGTFSRKYWSDNYSVTEARTQHFLTQHP
jgi:hypothetical protein